jgi:hypothetical protein
VGQVLRQQQEAVVVDNKISYRRVYIPESKRANETGTEAVFVEKKVSYSPLYKPERTRAKDTTTRSSCCR